MAHVHMTMSVVKGSSSTGRCGFTSKQGIVHVVVQDLMEFPKPTQQT